jgi:putative transposase
VSEKEEVPVSEKYAFIAGEEGNYPLNLMFRWAKVSKSGFYEWRGRGLSATASRRAKLAGLITALFQASDGTYGYRRVHADLLRSGYYADDETVRLIMRELGLQPCQPRPFRPTTTIAGDAGGIPDLLRRDFSAQRDLAP